MLLRLADTGERTPAAENLTQLIYVFQTGNSHPIFLEIKKYWNIFSLYLNILG